MKSWYNCESTFWNVNSESDLTEQEKDAVHTIEKEIAPKLYE
jgi:hypothetical protein